MTLQKEINELIRWTGTFTFINMGLASICLYLMMRKETCSQFIQDTFFNAGKFWVLIGCLMFAMSLLTNVVDFIVRLRQGRHSR